MAKIIPRSRLAVVACWLLLSDVGSYSLPIVRESLVPKPVACRVAAYDLFRAQLPVLESTTGLVRCAIAVASHALDDVVPEQVEGQLADLAQRVKKRIRTNCGSAVVAHLHDLLFDEEGFRGNENDFYSPLNSYLPTVLQTKQGIPISLVLVYKAVGEQIGLTIEGINAPGHFMARLRIDGDTMLVDPFESGRIYTRDEAFARMEQAVGQPLERSDYCLRAATHRQWISRMLSNLQYTFSQTDRQLDLAAMTELQKLLEAGE